MRESLAAFGRVYRSRPLRLLQLALAASSVGAWSYTVAIAVYAYREDGVYAVGIIGLVRWLAAGVASPLTGVLGDRFPRVRVMAASDAIRVALLAAMAGIAVADGPSLAVYALSIAGTVAGTAFRPAQAALVPSLARTPDELAAANVAASTIDGLGMFVGGAVGGALVAGLGVPETFVGAALLLLVSAVAVARIHEPARDVPADAEAEEASGGGMLRESLAGFRAIREQPHLRVLVVLFAAQTMVDGALEVLAVVLALEALETGAAGVGLLNSAIGVGGILGAAVAAALVGRRRLGTDFAFGIALWGLPLALVGLVPEAAVALVAFAVIGIANTVVDVTGDTLMQRSVDERVLARVFGAMEGLMLAAIGVGSVAAPLLVDRFGVRAAAVVVGLVLPVLAVVFWRTLARVDAAAAAPESEALELVRRTPVFALLPQPALEQVARNLGEQHVRAGATVFSQGDRGDIFYIVERGRVDVAVDGRTVETLTQGDSFGEIALLRDAPRTATVVAAEDSVLRTVQRDVFLGALGAHVEAAEAAEAAARARLARARPGFLAA